MKGKFLKAKKTNKLVYMKLFNLDDDQIYALKSKYKISYILGIVRTTNMLNIVYSFIIFIITIFKTCHLYNSIILDKNNEKVGEVYLKKKFYGLNRYELILRDKIYYFFVVNLLDEGTKIPVYIDNSQIAIIEKENLTRDRLDEYSVFVKSNFESDFEAVSLFVLYYDHQVGDRELSIYGSEVTYSLGYTFNKKIREKYDPNFKNSL